MKNVLLLIIFLITFSISAQVDLGDNINSCQGSTETLDATTTNAISYQWFLNNAIISGETQATLDITTSGAYKVEVEVAGNIIYQDELNATFNNLPNAFSTIVIECDDETLDGITNFDLTQYKNLITDDLTNNTVRFFLTPNDANSNINEINSPFTNTVVHLQELYVRVENNSTQCVNFTELIIEVYTPPTSIEPLTACETDGDGIEIFDLSTANTSTLFIDTIIFFESQSDAENDTNPIANSTSYINTSINQTIYARITNNIGCDYITTLNLEVFSQPVINTPTDLANCHIEFDGYVLFNLSLKNSEILNGLDASLFQLTYHTTYDMALEGSSPLNENPHYANSDKTLYVRAENTTTGCFSITSLNLIINQEQITQFSPARIYTCDDDNDGIAMFDLTSKNNDILNGSNSTMIFYTTNYDATNNTNPITNPTSYINTAINQTIYARAQTTEGCLSTIISFQLRFSNPIINLASDYFMCFSENSIVLNSGFNPALYDIEWKDDNDIILGIQNAYTVNQAGTYYLTVTEEATNCSTTQTINVVISDEIVLNTPSDLIECIDNSTGMATFDLTSVENQLGINLAEFSVKYYISPDYAAMNMNEITYPQAYISDTSELFDGIWIGVQSLMDGCIVTTSFNINALDCNDNDSDNVPNYQEDINNNGDLTDDDTDLDGIPNYLDNDDGDNIETIIEFNLNRNINNFVDTDNDTIENYLDDDDDGDGVSTINEDYNQNGDPTDDDTNFNGIPDYLENSVALNINTMLFNTFNIYPNPVKNELTITFTKDLSNNINARILNLQGQIIYKEILNNTINKLNLSTLNDGIYLLEIKTSQNLFTQKIIVK